MTDPGELRCYILYQSSPSPLLDKAIGNLFAGFLFRVWRRCGSGCGWWEESPIYFLSQWGEAVYFTLRWCVSNRGNHVHLGLGIKSDRRTKKLKSRRAKRKAFGGSHQQVSPTRLCDCWAQRSPPGCGDAADSHQLPCLLCSLRHTAVPLHGPRPPLYHGQWSLAGDWQMKSATQELSIICTLLALKDYFVLISL